MKIKYFTNKELDATCIKCNHNCLICPLYRGSTSMCFRELRHFSDLYNKLKEKEIDL